MLEGVPIKISEYGYVEYGHVEYGFNLYSDKFYYTTLMCIPVHIQKNLLPTYLCFKAKLTYKVRISTLA